MPSRARLLATLVVVRLLLATAAIYEPIGPAGLA